MTRSQLIEALAATFPTLTQVDISSVMKTILVAMGEAR